MSKNTTVADYLAEPVSFGGLIVPRGQMILELTEMAKTTGHPNPSLLVESYLRGHDQYNRQRIKSDSSQT